MEFKQDYAKAKEYFEMANRLCNPRASSQLRDLYANGLGVQQDYSIAFEYYAKYKLGFLYKNGYGVKPKKNLKLQIQLLVYHSEQIWKL